MSERFNKDQQKEKSRPRTERVQLAGGPVWVRAMSVSDAMHVTQKSERPAIDPRGGIDRGEALLWQVVVSCYYDEEGAERVFSEQNPEDVRLIFSMPWDEFQRLLSVINRVNGQDPEEVELLRDFTAARQAAASLPS